GFTTTSPTMDSVPWGDGQRQQSFVEWAGDAGLERVGGERSTTWKLPFDAVVEVVPAGLWVRPTQVSVADLDAVRALPALHGGGLRLLVGLPGGTLTAHTELSAGWLVRNVP